MTSGLDLKRVGFCLSSVTLTAALLWFGSGLFPIWPLMWFAPLPVLLFAARASWWGAALAAALGWLLGSLNTWNYFHSVLEMPAGVVIGMALCFAVVFALAVSLHRALLKRGAYWSALVAFPSLWITVEYLQDLSSPHGTAGSLAYSQLNFLPFLQLSSVTGPWGMSFLLLLFPSALATALHVYSLSPKQSLRIVGLPLGLTVAVLILGATRLSWPASGDAVKVGLVASDPPFSPDVADAGPPTTQLLQAYAEAVEVLATKGAKVVVLPEKLGVIADPDLRDTDALFQSVADRRQIVVVVGLVRVVPPVKYNEARVYQPGRDVLTYDKQHMLPPFESEFSAGNRLTLLAHASGRWGVAICKDMDFSAPSREYGKAGAGLLLVPAWDFIADRFAHGHIAVMRGVESGFTVVRAAKQGYLAVSDNRGRIVAQAESNSSPFAMLVAEVPTLHTGTVYLLWGDWFAWVGVGMLAVTLVQLVRVRNANPTRQVGY